MHSRFKAVGVVVAATTAIGLGTAGAVMANGGFDNPSANQPPQIIKFSVNKADHDGPGCGLTWGGDGTTAIVKHGRSGPGNNGCIAGQKINSLAQQFPGGRSTWSVWVGEPKTDITQYGHGPFKGWAKIVGTDSSVPDQYDFALQNTSHDGRAIYLDYTSAP